MERAFRARSFGVKPKRGGSPPSERRRASIRVTGRAVWGKTRGIWRREVTFIEKKMKIRGPSVIL